MTVFLSPVGGAGAQFFDNNGNPLSGGKLYTYSAGTTTPQATYTSSSGAAFHTNPIVLDSAGRVPGSSEIWLSDGQVYKFVLKTSADVLLATWDQIGGINFNFVNYIAESEVQTALAGQTVFILTSMTYTPGINGLTVYVDGVNKYEGIDYTETDSTTVTFSTGVSAGAKVKFTSAIQLTGSTVDSSTVAYVPPFIGSIATTTENKLSQFMSVKDFGAVGDGVTDDTVAIRNAVAVGAGRTIFFPKGVYLVSGTVTVPQRTSLTGEGRGASFIKLASTFDNVFVFGSPSDAGDHAYGSEVSHMSFYVDRPPVDPSTTNLQYKDTLDGAFIRMHGARTCTVRDCRFDWKAHHVVFHGGDSNHVYNNYFFGIWDLAAADLRECEYSVGVIYSATHGTPWNYHITGNTFNGLESSARPVVYGPYGSVTHSQAIGPRNHFYSDGIDMLVFSGNLVRYSGSAGVFVYSLHPSRNVHITDNTFDQSSQYDLQFGKVGTSYLVNVNISDNVFNGLRKSSHAVVVDDSGDGTLVVSSLNLANNVFSGYSMAPISLGGVWGALITGNMARDYNCQYASLASGADTDGTYAAAVFLYGSTRYTHVTDNVFGGGDDYYNQVANGCSYGIYSAIVSPLAISQTNNVDAGLNSSMSVGLPVATGVVGFMARGVTNTTSTGVKQFNVVDYNYSNSYNPATGVFTAPVTGLYSIGIYGTAANSNSLILFIAVNSFSVAAAAAGPPGTGVDGASTSGTFILNAGDTVTCNQSAGAYLWANAPDSTFSVALVTQI